MGINYDNECIDFSLAQKDTLVLQRVSGEPRPELPIVPRTPKKTRLERLTLSGATSALIQAIRRVRAERLPEYFELTCDWRQHETAVICGPYRLTYQQLDLCANRLAHFLISRGVGKGNPIGILLEHSLDTYIALLAVLKAGAAFVPLDPSFPAELLAFIAQDAGLRGLLSSSTFREQTSILRCPVLELDQAYEVLSTQQETRPQVRVDPASLCYIMYTLGTTDRPKGVAVSHANIVNFLHVATPIYGVRQSDRVYQGTSIAFASSFKEIWPAWIAGATLVVGPQDFSHGLTAFLIEQKITVLCCMPTLLATIESDVPSLRSLIIGDQPCPPYLVSRWARPGLRMLNTYGPVETTVMATWSELFPSRPVTIGVPLPTYQIYILDDQFRPVEDGQGGEICIGGPGVAIGYLNLPHLTNERFILNPVERDRDMIPRLYRTGDLGRITPSGEIEYLGHVAAQLNVQDYPGSQIDLVALSQAATVPLRAYGLAPQPSIGVTPAVEAETSRLKLLKQLSIKQLYTKVMTDPLYKNSIFNMTSTFMLGGLGFVFWIIIARLYKPESVGIATTLISIMTLLSSLTILGMNTSLIRYLPRSVNKSELINSSFFVVMLATLSACVIFLLGLQSFSPQLLFLRSNTFYMISFCVFVVTCSWNMLIESTFMAFRAAKQILLKNTIVSILKLILPFALIAFGAYGVFASNAAAFAVGVLVSIIILILNFKVRPSLSINVPLIRKNATYSLANYLAAFMFNLPPLVLPILILNALSAKYAAYYYVASMIQNNLQIIPLAAAQALLTEGSYNEDGLKKHVKKALMTIIVILLPATVALVLGGNILLQFVGKNYANGAFTFLQLYSVSTIFTALLIIANAIMKVKHQTKALVFSNIIATALTLWLSYAFISGQLVGVGWGWTLGQAIVGLACLLFIIRNLVA